MAALSLDAPSTRLFYPRLAAALLVWMPCPAFAVDCDDDHYVSGSRVMPTHHEAMAACRALELKLVDRRTGHYDRVATCHDVAAPRQHGDWYHGRLSLQVRARDTQQTHAFEGLWMCKSHWETALLEAEER